MNFKISLFKVSNKVKFQNNMQAIKANFMKIVSMYCKNYLFSKR
jgi:hypothetical protein